MLAGNGYIGRSDWVEAGFMNMKKEDWKQLSEEKYRALFKGSAVKRAKYSGLIRNIRQMED